MTVPPLHALSVTPQTVNYYFTHFCGTFVLLAD